MLSGIPSLLCGRLLHRLDDMGHTDCVVIADANFPAHRLSREVIDLPAAQAADAVRAIRSVLPLDEGCSVKLMAAGEPDLLPVQHEILTAALGADDGYELLARDDFYTASTQASVIVRTGESRPFGNVLLVKGVVQPGEMS